MCKCDKSVFLMYCGAEGCQEPEEKVMNLKDYKNLYKKLLQVNKELTAAEKNLTKVKKEISNDAGILGNSTQMANELLMLIGKLSVEENNDT